MNRLDKIIKTKPVLSNEQALVFLFQFNLFDIKELFFYLSENEIERADKLRIEQKRKQFVVTRGLLKVLLANCLGKQTEEIVFSATQHCKPYINEQFNNKPVEFNVSHSDDYGLIAITLENKVGVDIEAVNPEIDYQSLSNRFFSYQERDALMALDKDQRLEAFYQTWTRKESFIKAIGKGIAFGLNCFSVPVQKKQYTDMEIVTFGFIKGQWFCYDLMDLDHYKIALTTCRKGLDIIIY